MQLEHCPNQGERRERKGGMKILRGGRLVSFSPCIEQVQRTATMMRESGFVQVECIEVRREEKGKRRET